MGLHMNDTTVKSVCLSAFP